MGQGEGRPWEDAGWLRIREQVKLLPPRPDGQRVGEARAAFERVMRQGRYADRPLPIFGGTKVPEGRKVAFRWEALAMHYFHGDIDNPSSLVNGGTRLAKEVWRAAQTVSQDDIDRCMERGGGLALTRLEQVLTLKEARGIKRLAVLDRLTQAYHIHVVRQRLLEAVSGTGLMTASDLEISLLHRVYENDFGILDEGRGGAEVESVMTGPELRFRQTMAEAEALLKRMEELGAGHSWMSKEIMGRCLEALRLAADEHTGEALRELEWNAYLARKEGGGHLHEAITEAEHQANRAVWLQFGGGCARPSVVEVMNRRMAEGKLPRPFTTAKLDIAVSEVDRMFEAEPPRTPVFLSRGPLFGIEEPGYEQLLDKTINGT